MNAGADGAPSSATVAKTIQHAAQAANAGNGQLRLTERRRSGPSYAIAAVVAASTRRGRCIYQYSRSLTRRRAIDWLCSWQTRDSVTFSTAAISFRFMSCS